jgi:P pilus assembly chaperone PapD
MGLILAAASTGSAQGVPGGLGLDVSPAKVEMEIPIGARYNMPMTVQNSSGSSIHVVVTPSDFRVTPKGDYEFLKVGEARYSLLKYASINPREFDLSPGTTQQVRVTFTMPTSDGSMSGEYAGVIFFQTRPERRGRTAVAFSARIAAKLYSVVPETAKPGGEVSNFSVSRATKGQQYDVTFRNSGNVHLYLGGYVEVRRAGEVVDKISIPPGELVERGTDRLLSVTGHSLPAGSYEAIAAVDYGAPKLVGGAVKFTVQ